MTVQGLNSDYRIASSEECIKYLEEFGLGWEDDNPDYFLPSQSGLVYTPPTGEFILMPVTHIETYPCLIFKNKEAFEYCLKKEFFPIGDEHMTWLEKNASKVKYFLEGDASYTELLVRELNMRFPVESIEAFEKAFTELSSCSKDSTKSAKEKEAVLYSYAIAFSCYLIQTQDFEYELRKEYEIYNPYFKPILIKEGKRIDIIDKILIFVSNRTKNSFRNFCISSKIQL